MFRRHGYDGATMSVISAETSLGRSSIYHHFPGGKAQMAACALRKVGDHFERVIFPALYAPGTLDARMRRMGTQLRAYYEGGKLGCLLGAFARSGTTPEIRTQANALLEAWVEAIVKARRSETDESRKVARDRAMDYVCALQGALVVVALTGKPRSLLRALERTD